MLRKRRNGGALLLQLALALTCAEFVGSQEPVELGAVAWRQAYRRNGQQYPQGVAELLSGDIIVAGRRSTDFGVPPRGFWMRVSATGEDPAFEILVGESRLTFVEPTADGGFVAC